MWRRVEEGRCRRIRKREKVEERPDALKNLKPPLGLKNLGASRCYRSCRPRACQCRCLRVKPGLRQTAELWDAQCIAESCNYVDPLRQGPSLMGCRWQRCILSRAASASGTSSAHSCSKSHRRGGPRLDTDTHPKMPLPRPSEYSENHSFLTCQRPPRASPNLGPRIAWPSPPASPGPWKSTGPLPTCPRRI